MYTRPILVTLTLLMGLCAGRAETQQPGREAELEVIRDQIMVLQGRLNSVRQEASGLRGDLEQTEVALELQRTRLAEATGGPVAGRGVFDPGRRRDLGAREPVG